MILQSEEKDGEEVHDYALGRGVHGEEVYAQDECKIDKHKQLDLALQQDVVLCNRLASLILPCH